MTEWEAPNETKYAKILSVSSDDYRSGLTSILRSLDNDKRLRGVYKIICSVRNPKALPRSEYIEGILKKVTSNTAYKVLGRKWITKLLIQKYLTEKGRPSAKDDLKITWILECLEFWGCPPWKEGAKFHGLKSSAKCWEQNRSDPHLMRQMCEGAGKITVDGAAVQKVDERLFDQISAGLLHQGVEVVDEEAGATVFRVTSGDDSQSEVWVEEDRIVSIAIRRNVEACFDALSLCDDSKA